MPRPGAKERIRQFFLANVGNVVTSIQIRDSAGVGVTEWARGVQELREEGNWPILTHNDSADLKPGQYLLKEAAPEKSAVHFSRMISAKLRAEVLDRNDFFCQMCGLSPGEIYPATGRKVRLHIGLIKDKSLGGKEELMNLRALCSICNRGSKCITTKKPTAIWLLSQIRRAGQDEQLAVLKWLRNKFG
jgi:hypothetical protein